MTHHVTIYCERNGHEIEVECAVRVDHDAGEPRSYASGGSPPSDDVEIESCEPDIELTEGEMERAIELAYEAEIDS